MFNVMGHMLHSLWIYLPKEISDIKDLALQILQQTFKGMCQWPEGSRLEKITDALRQVFFHRDDDVLGGCSRLLYGDFGKLPPEDLPLYFKVASHSAISDIGRSSLNFLIMHYS